MKTEVKVLIGLTVVSAILAVIVYNVDYMNFGYPLGGIVGFGLGAFAVNSDNKRTGNY